MKSLNSERSDKALISLVAPMYNEEEVLEVFFGALQPILNDAEFDYEIICVNDGSKDNTLSFLKEHAARNERIKIVDLSRNYGKEPALSAGLDFATGDAVIPIDCDLQDPPEVILEMIKEWKKGFQVVLAKRIDRSSDSWLKRWTSKMFYKLIDWLSDIAIPANVGDFRLLDRAALDAVRAYGEKSRFMKGIFASLGFKETVVEYVRPSRAAGETKWNYIKLYKLALEGIISFTCLPLKIWSYIGAIVAMGAFCYGLYIVALTVLFGKDTPGYASLMVVMLFMTGLILLCLGVIGEYLSRIYIEVKARPLYIVMDTIGFDKLRNEP
jgi:glycosyltransferase involved in cell wall biosynthesis